MNLHIPISFSKCQHRIRVGNEGDGGYVICEQDLLKSEILFSFGISDNWTFEENFQILNSSSSVHAYDHSVDIFSMIRKMFYAFPNLILRRIGYVEFVRRIRLPKYYSDFFQGDVKHFVEKVTLSDDSENRSSIATIFSRSKSDNIFLKIDIEGSEYEVLQELLGFGARVSGMAIEFHDISTRLDEFLEVLGYLSDGFDVIHIHGNNYDSIIRDFNFPNTIEITFSPKDVHSVNLVELSSPTKYLDSTNNPFSLDLTFTVGSFE